VLSSFELCSVAIAKDCTDGELNPGETGFVFNYSIVVTNDGAGTLHDLIVVDNSGTPGNTADDDTFTLATLAGGATHTFTGSFDSTLNPPTNTATVAAAGSSGGPRTITATGNDTCPQIDRDPRINVTKCCTTELTVGDNNIVLSVNFSGQVCNATGGDSGLAPIGLTNVTVTDDAGTPGNASDDEVVFGPLPLPANTCQPFSGSYAPNSISTSDPQSATFTDTVTAIGTASLGFGQATDTASDTCAVCTRDECEPDPTP
jgi:hypothetical protein